MLRNAEQAQARNELSSFIKLMNSPQKECVIQAIFKLIDGESTHDVPSCGRCPACRARHKEAPRTLSCRGLEQAWPISFEVATTVLPTERILVVPNDPTYESGFEALVERLAFAGTDQFLIPDELAEAAAKTLARLSGGLGLIMGHKEFLDPGDASLARVPTALFLTSDNKLASRLLARCSESLPVSHRLPLAVVGRPEREIDDRRLDQTVSRFAPYTEDVLDALVRTKELV